MTVATALFTSAQIGMQSRNARLFAYGTFTDELTNTGQCHRSSKKYRYPIRAMRSSCWGMSQYALVPKTWPGPYTSTYVAMPSIAATTYT